MIHVVNAGAYSFVGEWNPVTQTMTSPRVLQTRQVSATEIKVVMAKMIGEPKVITIHGPVSSYELTDKGLCDYYRSEVSGIKIVSAVPGVKQ